MASRKTESKLEPNLAEAAEKASLVIRGLQSRLQQPSLEPTDETSEQLERQLEQYFARIVSGEIRLRVVDGVADRILHQWEQTAIEDEVVEKLIDRVMARLAARSDAR